MAKLCSIPECTSRSRRYGLCVKHSTRFERHGDPHVTKHLPNGTAKRYLREIVLPHQGDGCLIWPFNRVGKGQAYIYVSKNRRRYVCPLICETLYGPAPSPEHEAAHSCGKGHLGCVNPKHLRWATRTANRADMVEHGTIYRGSHHAATRLTEDAVRQIRALKGTATQREIGERFGVTEDVIGCIHRDISWAWLD